MWKAKQLSMDGRVTFAIIEALPTYSMLSSRIHMSYVKEIQKCHRTFIWGDTNSGKHIHIVKCSQNQTRAWDETFKSDEHNLPC